MKYPLILFFLIWLVLIPGATASGISISPSSIQLEIYRGETAETLLTISNPSEDELKFRITAEDMPDWFEFPVREGTLEAGSSREIKIKVSPPLDAANGEYSTFITLYLEPAEPASQFSLSLAASIKTKIVVSGKQVVSLSVNEISLKDTEQGMPLQITAGLANSGNVRAKPSAEITLRKNTRLVKKTTAELAELLPGAKSSEVISLSTQELEPGNYTATATILLGRMEIAEQEMAFLLHPYGTFTRSGKIIELSLAGEPKAGEAPKLTGKFQNTGSIAMSAQLVSELYHEESLIEAVRSEETLIQPGETAELVSYFSPKKPGSYTISSRVLFGGKATEPRELSFNIRSAPTLSLGGILISATIILMGLMLYYGKEVWKMAGKKIEGKVYYCIDCNRPIKHKGRCMLCNMTAKKRLDAQARKYAD